MRAGAGGQLGDCLLVVGIFRKGVELDLHAGQFFELRQQGRESVSPPVLDNERVEGRALALLPVDVGGLGGRQHIGAGGGGAAVGSAAGAVVGSAAGAVGGRSGGRGRVGDGSRRSRRCSTAREQGGEQSHEDETTDQSDRELLHWAFSLSERDRFSCPQGNTLLVDVVGLLRVPRLTPFPMNIRCC